MGRIIEKEIQSSLDQKTLWSLLFDNKYVVQYMGCKLEKKEDTITWFMEKDDKTITLLEGKIISESPFKEITIETFNPHRHYDQHYTLTVVYKITDDGLKIKQGGFEQLPDTDKVYEENKKGWDYSINALRKIIKEKEISMEHQTLAIQLFNQTWDLLDKKDRTESEDYEMIHKAHASLYHWMQVGTPLHFQRGEWMVSHVYASLKMAESAIHHAKRCLQLTEDNKITDFDLTFAYEAMARAYAINKDPKYKEFLREGLNSLDQIKDKDDRKYAKSELENI